MTCKLSIIFPKNADIVLEKGQEDTKHRKRVRRNANRQKKKVNKFQCGLKSARKKKKSKKCTKKREKLKAPLFLFQLSLPPFCRFLSSQARPQARGKVPLKPKKPPKLAFRCQMTRKVTEKSLKAQKATSRNANACFCQSGLPFEQ